MILLRYSSVLHKGYKEYKEYKEIIIHEASVGNTFV
jgi:hypothetical protein